jgi:hypothetical protein
MSSREAFFCPQGESMIKKVCSLGHFDRTKSSREGCVNFTKYPSLATTNMSYDILKKSVGDK